MDREQIERLHNSGRMPAWAYYQQVKKPWYVAMEEQEPELKHEYYKRQQERQEAELVKDVINRVIEGLFK